MQTTTNTLPAAMQQIAQSVHQATADMLAATNDARAFLGLGPIEVLSLGDGTQRTLGEMMGGLRIVLAETVAAFGGLAGAIHTWTGTPTPTARTLAPATVDLSVEASCERAMAARDFVNVHEEYGNVHEEYAPIPEPLVAPTISGGITQPSRIDAADLDAPIPTPEPEPTPEPDGDDEGSEELDLAEPVNRIATHLHNGQVEPGEELATVLGVEPAGTGKRPRSRKKS